MCEATTLSAIAAYVSANAGTVSAVTAVASAAATAYGQHEQARAVAKSANEAEEAANATLRDRQQQINQKATEDLVARSRQATLEVGALNAILADTGLTGESHARLTKEAEGNAYVDMTTIERNRQAAATQGATQAMQNRALAQSRINQTRAPSLFQTGLRIAAVGTEEYARRQSPK